MVIKQHRFGGEWTEVKLQAISAYSEFFTGAISGIFDLWYVDPFAGTGERTAVEQSGGLFENKPISSVERQYPGSASRALTVNPPFHHFRFGDSDPRHVDALLKLKGLYPHKDIEVVRDDANAFIQNLFSKPPWAGPAGSGSSSRALVFLDPYGMEVRWLTLEKLAACQKADVWLLANLKAAVQQLSRRHEKIDISKRRALNEYFGTADWEKQFYNDENQSDDLFGNIRSEKGRNVEKIEIALFHQKRLKTLFAYVSEPLSLKVGNVDDYFLLYCMSNNQSPKARGLIAKGATWVINKYKQASRHRSFRQEGDQ